SCYPIVPPTVLSLSPTPSPAAIYSLSLHDALPIFGVGWLVGDRFEKRLVAATCMLMHMTGLLLLTYAVALPMLIAFAAGGGDQRSEEHTSELQSRFDLVCRLLLEKKN